MLNLDTPDDALPPALLAARGGFAWWYVDAVDERGDGLVLIASWGLPFLPGWAASHRAGTAAPAGDRPSVNLVLLRRHRPVFYALEELPPEACVYAPGPEQTTWRFGPSTLTLRKEGGVRRLDAELDLANPAGERLRGTFTLTGPATRATPASPLRVRRDDARAHLWTPLTGPARLRGRFTAGDRDVLRYDGPAYHDRNGSQTPLHALGIGQWVWSRAVVGDMLWIAYLSWPDRAADPAVLVLVTVGPDGAVTVHEDVEVVRGPRRLGRFGLDHHAWIAVHGGPAPVSFHTGATTDDSPFYLRHTVRWRVGDVEAPGIAEWCRPARIDRAWMRPLVRMAVQPADARAASWWLPLFAGTAHDRRARLGRWWRGVRALPGAVAQ
jgi:carotenoid 1,2-hydratase